MSEMPRGSNARLIGKLAILTCIALALAPLPALACTVSRTNSGATAEERMAGRTDVRRVIGIYRMERVDDPGNIAQPALIHGRLTTRRGTSFRIFQAYWQQLADCMIYGLPMADASGTFYLSRRARNGEHELLDWSGEHIPGNGMSSGETDAEGQP